MKNQESWTKLAPTQFEQDSTPRYTQMITEIMRLLDENDARLKASLVVQNFD